MSEFMEELRGALLAKTREEVEPEDGDPCDRCGEPAWDGELVKVEEDWVWLCAGCGEKEVGQ